MSSSCTTNSRGAALSVNDAPWRGSRSRPEAVEHPGGVEESQHDERSGRDRIPDPGRVASTDGVRLLHRCTIAEPRRGGPAGGDSGSQGTPAEWAKGVSDALSKKSDSIDLLAGLDPAAVSAQVTQAKAKGTPVVATHLYDVDQAIDPNIAAATNIPYEQAGRLLADWVIAKTEGKAKVLVTTINQVNSTVPMVAGIEDEFATKCGDGCSITKIDTTIADLGKLQQQVQSALTSDADINYVINLYDSAQAPQTEAAIKTLGKDLKIATFNGTPDILKLITPDSVIQMDVGENLEWIAYAAIDQHLRLLSGGEATTTPNVPIRVFDATNVAESSADGAGFGTAYRDEYATLWGLK